jgi:hypothetical protein
MAELEPARQPLRQCRGRASSLAYLVDPGTDVIALAAFPLDVKITKKE